MDFRVLEIFATVVEKRSFSLAAATLQITQPTVSQHIRQLEEELNTPLILRSTREFSLTPEGKRLYEDSVFLLKYREKLMNSFLAERRHTVDIGVSTIPASYLLPHIIFNFHKSDPLVHLKAFQSNSQTVIEKVADKTLDVGIVGMKTDHPHCHFHLIFKDKMVLVTPNTYHYQNLKRENASLYQLLKEPMIIRETGSGSSKQMDLLMEEVGIQQSQLEKVATVNDMEVIKKLIVQGIGTSFMSKVVIEDLLEEGKVLTFSFKEFAQRDREFYLIWNKQATYPSYIKDFIQSVKEMYR